MLQNANNSNYCTSLSAFALMSPADVMRSEKLEMKYKVKLWLVLTFVWCSVFCKCGNLNARTLIYCMPSRRIRISHLPVYSFIAATILYYNASCTSGVILWAYSHCVDIAWNVVLWNSSTTRVTLSSLSSTYVPYTCISKVYGSNFRQATGYPDWSFTEPPPPAKKKDTSHQGCTNFSQVWKIP